jgi:hypothetical protein
VLLLMRGLLTLLDRIWQRLDNAAVSTGWKVTLLTLPVAIGAVAVTALALAPRSEPLYASMIASGVAVVGCMVAGIIMLAVRIRLAH